MKTNTIYGIYDLSDQATVACGGGSSENLPRGAGCIISHTQESHDKMMNYLMDGVYNPETITVKILSVSNMKDWEK